MSNKSPTQLIKCEHYRWRLTTRGGVYQADGRGDVRRPGRHSLNTKHYDTALSRLRQLDNQIAQKQGLIPSDIDLREQPPLGFQDGRELYFQYITRPDIAGGVAKSTVKRYRAVFDNFSSFATAKRITSWQEINKQVLIDYTRHLEDLGRAPKTIRNENCHSKAGS